MGLMNSRGQNSEIHSCFCPYNACFASAACQIWSLQFHENEDLRTMANTLVDIADC